MATSKKRNPQFTTPRGVFVYPSLDKPDHGTKDFPKPDGEFKVTLRLSTEVAEAWRDGPLAAVISEARQEADRAFAALPIATRKKLGKLTWNEVGNDEYDKATEEATGNVLFKFAMKASGTRKDGTDWSQKPAVYDAKGVYLSKVPQVWGGSEGRVSVEASPYFIPGTGAAGVSLRLKAVQLIKLVSGTVRDASGFGFAAEDDGFDASEYTAPAEDAAEGSGAGSEGADQGASGDF